MKSVCWDVRFHAFGMLLSECSALQLVVAHVAKFLWGCAACIIARTACHLSHATCVVLTCSVGGHCEAPLGGVMSGSGANGMEMVLTAAGVPWADTLAGALASSAASITSKAPIDLIRKAPVDVLIRAAGASSNLMGTVVYAGGGGGGDAKPCLACMYEKSETAGIHRVVPSFMWPSNLSVRSENCGTRVSGDTLCRIRARLHASHSLLRCIDSM